jgi:hypothetical protein
MTVLSTARYLVILLCLLACSNEPEVMSVRVVNDTLSTVTIKQCDTTCQQIHDVVNLNPGQSVEVNTSSGGVPNYWKVVGPQSSDLGCLNLAFSHYVDNAIVNISSRGRCPGP